MIDLSKKYYAVHVQASNFLNGIHYIPFTDEDIERMQREYASFKSEVNCYYDGEYLMSFMRLYLMEKFSYNACENERFWVMMFGDMEPVDMEAIISAPSEPRHVEVIVSIGEDECIQFNIPEANEEVNREEGEYDISTITCSDEGSPYKPCIKICRFCQALPHLTNTICIEELSVSWWDMSGHIESIEQDDNSTTYHCRNSLFPFKVEVIAHILYWYDEETPIYKE